MQSNRRKFFREVFAQRTYTSDPVATFRDFWFHLRELGTHSHSSNEAPSQGLASSVDGMTRAITVVASLPHRSGAQLNPTVVHLGENNKDSNALAACPRTQAVHHDFEN